MPRPLSAAARQKALDAAVDLLAETGIEGFTVDEVARRSGVAKSTLYRHWASGNHLLMASLDCHIEQVPTPDTGHLHGDLLSLFDTMGQLVATDGNRQLMLDMLAASARDPELADIKQTMMAERTKPITVLLTRAVERGEIPPVDLDQAGHLIHGPFMARTLFHNEPVTRDELLVMVTQIVRGLGGEPPSA